MAAVRSSQSRRTGRKLARAFYAREADVVARELVGKILVRRIGSKLRRARIVETEAYVGEHDLACHAAKGRTKRTEVMFGHAGHAYVYLIYGIHEMFNIVTGEHGVAQAVLIRAAEPLDGWDVSLSGPGKLASGMNISRTINGIDLRGDELFLTEPAARERKEMEIVTTRRVGVDYALDWKDAPLRFIDANSAAVSRRNWK